MRRGVLIALALQLAMLVVVSSASGAFHLMKIREVHEGGGAEADYVELQMYASGQGFVSGHHVVTYDGAGNQFQSFTFPSEVPNGESQRTILLAGMGAISATPDFIAPVDNFLPGPDGSVCFINTLPSNGIDCVSYGAAAPPTTNPSPVGTPAVQATGLAPGQSVERSIARGCATLLEAGDDTNDGGADFAIAAPSPRPNSAMPTESACGGGGGGGGGNNNPPNTEITKHPKRKSTKRRAKFKFSSTEQASSFECKLDTARYVDCNSPAQYRGLDSGKHKFQVRATDEAGNTDGTPAKFRFKVFG